MKIIRVVKFKYILKNKNYKYILIYNIKIIILINHQRIIRIKSVQMFKI